MVHKDAVELRIKQILPKYLIDVAQREEIRNVFTMEETMIFSRMKFQLF